MFVQRGQVRAADVVAPIRLEIMLQFVQEHARVVDGIDPLLLPVKIAQDFDLLVPDTQSLHGGQDRRKLLRQSLAILVKPYFKLAYPVDLRAGGGCGRA